MIVKWLVVDEIEAVADLEYHDSPSIPTCSTLSKPEPTIFPASFE